MIDYRLGNNLDLAQVIELYASCSLGVRRPIQDRARFAEMLRQANLVITAWDGELLVGIARSLTDFVYVTYVADLAVRESHQKHGIGRALIQKTAEAAPQASLVLLAAPSAVGYYPHIGFKHHPEAWTLKPIA